MVDTNRKEYVYIFDYSDRTICEIELSGEDLDLDNESLLAKYNLTYDDCYCMYSDRKIDNIINLNTNE